MTWLNQVETTSRDQLRESIEQNFTRFDAKLEQRIAELRAELRGALADQRAELIKWMFVFWAGNVATLGGLMFALFNYFRP